MTVIAGSVGVHGKFVQQIDDNVERSPVEKAGASNRKFHDDFAFDMKELNSVLNPAQKELFNAAITINTTFEDHHQVTSKLKFVGSKTETALLRFAKGLNWLDYCQTRESADTVQMIPFSSGRKAMGVVVKVGPDHRRLYVKGASENLTTLCTRHIAVGHESTRDSMDKFGRDGVETAMITELEKNIQRTIIFYANQMLRTIALCYVPSHLGRRDCRS
jgi:Ca2+-transporting ATPase